MISKDDTERTNLVDLAASNAAEFWYRLRYPKAYRSVRYVNGHQILVTITDYSVMENPITELMSDRSIDG